MREEPTRAVVVASFNVHAGIDGWGRGFDALGDCLALDADVLMLEEVLTPEVGPSLVSGLVDEGGYAVVAEGELAQARLLTPPALRGRAAAKWGPGGAQSPAMRIISPEGQRPIRAPRGRRFRHPEQARGPWGVALLSRLPVTSAKVIPLTPLARDPVRRVALVAELEVGGDSLHVVGTHFSHLSDGSPLRLAELRRLLGPSDAPGVLLGDMNCFGPPLTLALPGWRRAVRGRSWPAWRPICQPDHVFVSRAISQATGEVLPLLGSDHRPIRARLSW